MKFNIFPKMLSFVRPCLEVIKMVIASVASVALLGFACLTFTGSTVGFLVSTPLFIIFSPILVPATIATAFLATGLTAGSSLGGTALGLIIWLIKHRIGVKPKDNPPPSGAPPTTEGGSSAPSTKTLLPFFGTFADKPPGEAAPAGGATPPTSEAAPAGGLPKIIGNVKWTWTRDGAPFSGGWFGGSPVGETVGGSKPGVALNWAWTSWRGKTYTGNVPFGGFPANGGTPAGGPSAGPPAE